LNRFLPLYEPGFGNGKALLFHCRIFGGRQASEGGGLAAEGEDIEVLEWPLARALQAIREGEIVDAKTIMLLQHLALTVSPRLPR
jgi:hypothetical protein